MFPKLVALDTDGTIFTGKLDEKVWGKGPKASQKLAHNIQKVDRFTLRDRSNHLNQIHLGKDIPRIITDVLEHGASLAIVSRKTSKALCESALYYFKTALPATGETKSIMELVRYTEVVDEPKITHFKRIHGLCRYNYNDMILFDDDVVSNAVEKELGVTVQNCTEDQGLTWEVYSAGIERWRQSYTPPMQLPPPVKLSVAHFNDVYQVSEQTLVINGKKETIDVTRFATLLANVRQKWKDRSDGYKDGLTVFSGDLFSPSVESSTSRGRHMPAIINGLKVDVACVGNHEFDFGFPQLKKLISNTTFPWLLSNIIDSRTGKVPETMKEFHVLERAGVKVGFIGLVEKDWIATIVGWPESFKYRDMTEVGKSLSFRLRDPAGPHKCDLVIAVTHSRIPNDIKLARELGALSPSAQATRNIASEHGVDLLLGGHDHVYWISKGVSKWDGYDLHSVQPDAATDMGDILVVKSGTDFQDLSDITLTLKATPQGSIRKRVIQEITGKRLKTRASTPVNEPLKKIVDKELKVIRAAHAEPLFKTDVLLDVRSSYIRRNESPIGNWIADCLRPAYDEALGQLGYGSLDGVIACTGDFRGDRIYEPGPITLGDLMTILPYLDPTVVVELDANTLWDTLESGLSRWPTQEGRFIAISGLRVEWDSRRPAGERVVTVWLTQESDQRGENGRPATIDKEQVLRTSTRKYLIMAGEYMAQGGDGYDVLKDMKQAIGAENGQSKSALIRKFLLGAQLLKKQLCSHPPKGPGRSILRSKTFSLLEIFQDQPGPDASRSGERASKPELEQLPTTAEPESEPRSPEMESPSSMEPTDSGSTSSMILTNEVTTSPPSTPRTSSLKWLTSHLLAAAVLNLAEKEDVGLLDPYERQRARMTVKLLRAARKSIDESRRMAALAAGGSMDSQTSEADKVEDTVEAAERDAKDTLPTIRPMVDGRLRDISQS